VSKEQVDLGWKPERGDVCILRSDGTRYVYQHYDARERHHVLMRQDNPGGAVYRHVPKLDLVWDFRAEATNEDGSKRR
jgi:hypothetical protein